MIWAMINFALGFIAILLLPFIYRKRKERAEKKEKEARRRAQQQRNRTTTVRYTSHYNPEHVQTKNELIAELPRNEQLDYTHLFDALDILEDLIDTYSVDIYRQQADVEHKIRQKVQESSYKIKSQWESQAQRKKYRESIALHYASFTLADSIYEQMKKVGSMYNQLKTMNANLGNQIDELSNRINSRSGNLDELKRQHKALCDKRHQISQIQKVYGTNLGEYSSKLDNQNALTAQYRDYIGANFGEQGRAWLERLKKRKAASKWQTL